MLATILPYCINFVALLKKKDGKCIGLRAHRQNYCASRDPENLRINKHLPWFEE